ncbi:MAG: UDP-N-acetylglucosamine 1-carboxyvinyltransferase [Psittacicella sp.]
MSCFKIKGPKVLKGEVKISGAKNAALPIIFASILASEEIILNNIPVLEDTKAAIEILKSLGAEVEFIDNTLRINPKSINKTLVSYEMSSKMRASIWLLPALLAKYKEATIFLPGGCVIGKRPVDMHIAALRALNANIILDNLKIEAKGENLVSSKIIFSKVSVGATISAVIAGSLTKGITTLLNCAIEPEVIDLVEFLNELGAKIEVSDTTIVIYGVEKLHGGTYKIIPDRIEAGSFLIAAAISKGHIKCTNLNPNNLKSVLEVLKLSGVSIEVGDDFIIASNPYNSLKAIDISTQPYPGFPTDMQAQFSLLNMLSEGEAIIEENIFENRYMHVNELKKMGVNADIRGKYLYTKGVSSLVSSTVRSTDLRASISLVLAGIVANGETIVESIYHIDRGYENIEAKLSSLGADIERVEL